VSLTGTHRKRRKRYIGASDVPAIIGVSPWKTASDVYYDKTAAFEDTKDTVNKAIQAGVLLEDSVIDFAAQSLGVKVKRNQFRVHKEHKWASSTMDALIIGGNEGIEAKTTSMCDGWGEERTDQIPIYYIAQVQWQMFVTGLERVWVPCLMPDYVLAFKLYVVDRDEDIISRLVEQCGDFWKDNVLAGVPPAHTVPAPRTIQRMKRMPGKVVAVDDKLVAEYQAATAVHRESAKVLKQAKMKLLESLGDAEVGSYDGGVLRYHKSKRKGYTKEVPEATYRSLKIKEDPSD
jgi:putative phage-type endonuclease